MPTLGQLSEFDPQAENVAAYLERVELFFKANDIGEDKMVALFLSVIRAKTYSLLRDLLAPEKPQEKTLAELFKKLKDHYEPKPIVIAERFHFHRRDQGANESITEYVAELRRLAINCEFGEYLNEALRDRLVCGLRNTGIQKRLLSEAKLTLAKAEEIAQGMEAADTNAKRLHGGDPGSVDKITPRGDKTDTFGGRKHDTPCYRCGRKGHVPSACRFRDTTCHKCRKRGHIAKACRSGTVPRQDPPDKFRKKGPKQMHAVEERIPSDSEAEELTMFKVGGKSQHQNPIVVTMEVNGQQIPMEVDTGAAVSLISTTTRAKYFPMSTLEKTSSILTTYTGNQIPVVGLMKVQVRYGEQNAELSLYVVKGQGASLMGRDWIRKIRLNWKSIGLASLTTKTEALLEKYSEVFEEGLRPMNTFEASLNVKPGSKPRFHKARPVPFALKPAIESELDRLERAGVVQKVAHSQWAAPVVPVPKGDCKIRLCGDYKVTVNPELEVDQYPLPKPEELFTKLAGGKKFTKIDLTNAYQQMNLEESSREYVTINTHRGLYQFTRLPFGVASAPALFQRVMDTVLQGIDKTICYIDDILVTGSTQEEHLKNIEEVLRRLQKYGIRAKRAKCVFMSDKVDYLGHRIDADGLHTLASKVDAIVRAPSPNNVQELRSFLGLIHYYGKFLPSLAMLLHPLNRLLKDGQDWNWTEECTQAFEAAKQLLVNAPVLTHYDPSLPMKMAGDASAYGIGAVISHVYLDGSERPIAYASRALTATEKNYSQIEREALSLIYGVKKFHQYLYGRKFGLVTDHKPLTTLFGPKKGIPPLAAARLQRWALLLSAYSYEIEWKPTDEHANADGLSRLPLAGDQPAVVGSTTVEQAFVIAQVQALPVTVERLEKATRQDPLLSKIHMYVREGWPSPLPEEYQPYLNRKQELSTEGDCLMWGNRVVIPQKLRSCLVKELHRDHPGVVRMKAIARSYLWWPGLDRELEECARNCLSCQAVKSAPARAPLHPWLWPSKPWKRVHADFAGPFLGKMFLIILDAHSKWPEVIEMTSTTAEKTIAELRKVFSAYGLPEQFVTDNGPQFVAEEFAIFMKQNGIKHIRCAPYHPSSNGAVERFVQMFKRAMKATEGDGRSMSQRLASFLLSYRNTSHATTGRPPSELFLGRRTRTRLDLLRPACDQQVDRRQAKQKADHDRRSRVRELFIGQQVMAKNLRPGAPWMAGVIVERLGPLTYLVQVDSGQLWKRHLDHLRVRGDQPSTGEQLNPGDSEDWDFALTQEPSSASAEDPRSYTSEHSTTNSSVPTHRYPQRHRQAPNRYM